MLISDRAILSAATCFMCPFYNTSNEEEVAFYDNCTMGEFFVYPGDTFILNRYNVTDSAETIVYQICKEEGGIGCVDTDAYVIHHPKSNVIEYPNNRATVEYNFALIILPESMPAPSDLTPIALNSDPTLPEDMDDLVVMGWGDTNPLVNESYPDVPYIVDVNYVPNHKCMTDPFQYPNGTITESIMCAFAQDKDGCSGDQGKFDILDIRIQPLSLALSHFLSTLTLNPCTISGGPLSLITEDGPMAVGVASFGWAGTYLLLNL